MEISALNKLSLFKYDTIAVLNDPTDFTMIANNMNKKNTNYF